MLQLPVNPNMYVGVATLRTPIFNAAHRGDPAIVELLIKANADPNAPCEYFDDELDDVVESTPLHVASQHPDPDVVRILCSARADVNTVDSEGDTPLIVACESTRSLMWSEDSAAHVPTSTPWTWRATLR